MAHLPLKLAVGLAGLLLLGAAAALNVSLKQMSAGVTIPVEDQGRRWNPALFRALTFGHLPAAVDWLWMDSLQDETISHVLPGTHAGAYYTFDLITELDPLFFEVYPAGANLLAVIRNDGDAARKLLLKGEHFRKRQLPSYPEEFRTGEWRNAWAIPLVLAYVYLYELNDMPKAAGAFREAAAIAGSPAYLRALAERLEKPGGQYEVALRLLAFLIDGAKSDTLRRELLARRESLEVGHHLYRVNAEFQDFAEKRAGTRSTSGEKAAALWKSFVASGRVREQDPWGGVLSVNEDGRVVSTTPYAKVFGLE